MSETKPKNRSIGRSRCGACGARMIGTFAEIMTFTADHQHDELPPEPYTAAELVDMDDDADHWDEQRDADVAAYDGGPA